MATFIPEEGSQSADWNVDVDLIAENSDWNKSDSYTAETLYNGQSSNTSKIHLCTT